MKFNQAPTMFIPKMQYFDFYLFRNTDIIFTFGLVFERFPKNRFVDAILILQLSTTFFISEIFFRKSTSGIILFKILS